MPIYEYSCLKCGLKFDWLMRGGEEVVVCPKCDQKEVKRLISTFSFRSRDSQGNLSGSSSNCGSCSSHNCSSCSG